MKKRVLHVLDYQPKDIAEAIEQLKQLEHSGQISGLLFVAKVKHRKRPLVGAAGCCVSDPIAAIGAAGYMYGAISDIIFNN